MSLHYKVTLLLLGILLIGLSTRAGRKVYGPSTGVLTTAPFSTQPSDTLPKVAAEPTQSKSSSPQAVFHYPDPDKRHGLYFGFELGFPCGF